MDNVDNMDELVVRAFRPIVSPPPPSSDTSGMLVGPGNLCIRWMVSQFRRMARKSPLESGRQRPKSVRNKMPLVQFLRARQFRLCVDLPVYTLYGLEEACLDVSEVEVGSGPRATQCRQGHCRCGLWS